MKHFQLQHTPCVRTQISKYIVSAYPYTSFTVFDQGCTTCNPRCMDNPPLCLVVIQDTFEIGDKHTSVIITHDIEITIMGFVDIRCIVGKKRHTSLSQHSQTLNSNNK